jgi:hypothetical protein
VWIHPHAATTAAATDLYNGSATGDANTNVHAGDSEKATFTDADTDCAADFNSAQGRTWCGRTAVHAQRESEPGNDVAS